ncbi:AAA family ATPase [Bacteroides ovatus]|nr:AAA family ATPase [Bacteroides ovatus]
MIERILKSKLIEMANKYPIVTLTGPRQSGKSTLLRNSFQDYEYVSLEDPDMRLFATDDPRDFFPPIRIKTIIDEVQKSSVTFPPIFKRIPIKRIKKGVCICWLDLILLINGKCESIM